MTRLAARLRATWLSLSALAPTALARAALALAGAALTLAGGAAAEDAPAQESAALEVTPAQPGADAVSVLDGYLTLLEQQKLLGPPAQSVDELAELLRQAQEALLGGR